MSLEIWSIDYSSGHCSHPSGLIAYIDQEPTASGAIRCLGPFGDSELPQQSVLDRIADLSSTIKVELSDDVSYVIWGAYEEDPITIEHEFSILGSTCGFIPSISLMASATGKDWIRQWKFETNQVSHVSGICFSKLPLHSLAIDQAVLHPFTVDAEIEKVYQLLAATGHMNKSIPKNPNIEALRWH